MTAHSHFIDLPGGLTIKAAKVTRRPDGVVVGFDNVTETWMPITRTVQTPYTFTKHECDDRCLNAQGKLMKCECQCGGRNHGKGKTTITCIAA